MARRPEVFVRALSMEEGRKLQRITRTAKDPVKLRRAIVVMMSGQGQSVPDITSLMQTSHVVRCQAARFDLFLCSAARRAACWSDQAIASS